MKKKLKQYLLNILAKSRRQEGFTLIEMVVVIAIIVILILLIVPNLIGQKQKADDKTMDAFRTTLQTQIQLYENNEGEKPASLEILKDKKYITADQLKKAKDKGIEINNVDK
ncbi:MAG: competence type IV pilus major pilin ComGC [Candidatus Limosilactobacillus intestinavium]